MRKLSKNSIQEIVEKFQGGVSALSLAKEKEVSKLTIYYHLRRRIENTLIKNPICYTDYLKNSIYRLNKKLEEEDLNKEKRKCIKAEIARLKYHIHNDIKHKTFDAFIIQ